LTHKSVNRTGIPEIQTALSKFFRSMRPEF